MIKRPWGSYQTLVDGSDYKVKRISVKPDEQFSLQYHNHREEHWIIVEGTGIITQGEVARVIEPGENVYIPIKQIHRLNGGEKGVVFIEVQRGMCDEDDIVRLEDDYGRINKLPKKDF